MKNFKFLRSELEKRKEDVIFKEVGTIKRRDHVLSLSKDTDSLFAGLTEMTDMRLAIVFKTLLLLFSPIGVLPKINWVEIVLTVLATLFVSLLGMGRHPSFVTVVAAKVTKAFAAA